MSLFRPKLGVSAKTWIALTIVFWVPVILLAGILSYMFQNAIHNEVLDSVKIHLKGARDVYEERGRVLSGVLAQTSARSDVQESFLKKDSRALQAELLELGKVTSSLSLLFAVDDKQRVIARRNNKNGDIIRIGDALPRALITGEPMTSSELVGSALLATENEALAKLIKDIGMVQFVISPVKYRENTVGALVAGIVLTADPWLGNTVYNRFGAEVALFAGESPESSFLHSTASLPRSTWAVGQKIPDGLKEEISLGRPYYGQLTVTGSKVLMAAEPIKDGADRIIGALGVSMPAKKINALVIKTIGKGVAMGGAAAFIIALVVTIFVHADITRPIDLLSTAMDSVGKGELETIVELKTGDEFEKLGNGFNAMADGIREREERLKKHYEVAKLLMSTLDLKGLLNNMLKVVLDVTGSQMGIVYLYEAVDEKLSPIVHYGTVSEIPSLKPGEGYPGRAAAEKTTFVLSPPRDSAEIIIELGYTKVVPVEVAYVPLVHQDKLLGVLVLGSVKEFRKEERMLFDYLANQISIALDNAIMHHKIQELSITDPLTTLYNRRYLNLRLAEEWARSVRHNQPLSVLLSDADNFKSVNDTYGHEKGDEVLKGIAGILKKNVRKEDLAARYGGEEFVLVLPDTTSDEAYAFAERIRKASEGKPYDWMDRPVTVSIGVATFPDVKVSNFEELLQTADQAMYKAKVGGKNRVVVSGADPAKTS
ncbi:MAG: diguanylate cyclase [Deltaproteobacteria bacterium]|nr:diguanylate cyclase [Deltaproteobacteria bacterium]